MIRAIAALAFALAACTFGSGCGQKGPLKLPDPAPKPAAVAP